MTTVQAMSSLHRLLLDGAFVVTAELETTDDPDPGSVYRLADELRGNVDAVNCTDNSAAHPHLSSQAAARLLADRDVEPIVQFACRDRNRIGLQSDILGAAVLGGRNLCLMTGDDVTAGDHPETKPIYDLDGIHAIRIARMLRDEAVYLSGRPLAAAPRYLIGSVVNPFAPPLELRPMRLGKKIEAGAQFVQTQICFNLPKLRLFLARAEALGLLDRVWILGGVFVLRSARAARYLRDQVPGIDVPEDVIARMDAVPAERQPEEGVRIALEIVDELRRMKGISGVHLMSIRGQREILRVVEEAGLLPRPAGVGSVAAG